MLNQAYIRSQQMENAGLSTANIRSKLDVNMTPTKTSRKMTIIESSPLFSMTKCKILQMVKVKKPCLIWKSFLYNPNASALTRESRASIMGSVTITTRHVSLTGTSRVGAHAARSHSVAKAQRSRAEVSEREKIMRAPTATFSTIGREAVMDAHERASAARGSRVICPSQTEAVTKTCR